MLKELSTSNSIPSENIHQELKGNKDILRQRKLRKIVNNSLNHKEWLKVVLKLEETDNYKRFVTSERKTK